MVRILLAALLGLTLSLSTSLTARAGKWSRAFNELADSGKRLDVPEVEHLPSSVKEDALAAQKRHDDALRQQQIDEQNRITQQKLDEQRIADEKLAEQKRIDDKRIADEKIAEQKRIDDKRIADEKIAEQKRIDDKRIADEKIAQETALKQQRSAKRDFNFVAEPPIHREWNNNRGGTSSYTNKPTTDPKYPGHRFESNQTLDENGKKVFKETIIRDSNGTVKEVK